MAASAGLLPCGPGVGLAFRATAPCGRYGFELGLGCLQVLDDLGGDDLGRRQVVGVLQRLVAQPDDIERCLVTSHQFVVAEWSEARRQPSEPGILKEHLRPRWKRLRTYRLSLCRQRPRELHLDSPSPIRAYSARLSPATSR